MPGDDAPLEFSRAEVDALLRAAPWGEIRAQLVKFAMSRTKNAARAEDLAQNAMTRVLDAGYTGWNPRTKELRHHLMNLVKDDMSNARKSARVHREIAMSSEKKATSAERAAEIAAENVADGARTPEAALVAADLMARRTALLVSRLEATKDGSDPIRVLRAMESGLERPAEIALRLELPLARVVQARDRLAYHAKQVARELPDEAFDDDREAARDSEPAAYAHDAREDAAPDSAEDVA